MQSLSIVGKQFSPGVSRRTRLPDWLGVVASIGCAIHCAAMPFVITFLPMLGLSFLADESFHRVMVGVCAVLALLAFVPGWKVHRRWLPAGMAAAGLTIIAAAAFGLEDSCACCTLPTESPAAIEQQLVCEVGSPCCESCSEAAAAPKLNTPSADTRPLAGLLPLLTPIGGLMLVSAHLANRHLSCRCGCCPTDTNSSAS